MYLHAPRTKSTQQAPRIKPCRTGTKDEVILTHTEDEAMPTHTEDEPHRPDLPPYVCTGNVKFRISKTPLWCQKSFFLIQGTLQMTGHSQRRRHSSDDWAHSQRCGYSLKLTQQVPRTKPSRQAPRTKPSRQAPRTKSPGTKPSRQAPRSKSPGTKPSRQAPRMKPCRQVPRANPTDHTSLPMYVWGTFNSGFPKLRYGVKSHFFDSGTLQMTGHSQRCEYSSHYLAP